jgi:hypothetical protein
MAANVRCLIVLTLLLAAPRLADACSCMFSSPCRTYASADAVFAGDVVEVREGPLDGPPTPKVVRLRVASAYKGAVEVGQVATVTMPSGSSASCSLDIAPGARLVVFAGAEGERFTTNLCRGSHVLPAGAPWPNLPPPGGVVSGRLSRLDRDAPDRSLPDVAVWIVTPGGKLATRTDPTGAFRLAGVPAGRWTVQFGLDAHEHADQTIELQSADDCAEVYAWPRPRGQ